MNWRNIREKRHAFSLADGSSFSRYQFFFFLPSRWRKCASDTPYSQIWNAVIFFAGLQTKRSGPRISLQTLHPRPAFVFHPLSNLPSFCPSLRIYRARLVASIERPKFDFKRFSIGSNRGVCRLEKPSRSTKQTWLF